MTRGWMLVACRAIESHITGGRIVLALFRMLLKIAAIGNQYIWTMAKHNHGRYSVCDEYTVCVRVPRGPCVQHRHQYGHKHSVQEDSTDSAAVPTFRALTVHPKKGTVIPEKVPRKPEVKNI